jgi:hypothetical protein
MPNLTKISVMAVFPKILLETIMTDVTIRHIRRTDASELQTALNRMVANGRKQRF